MHMVSNNLFQVETLEKPPTELEAEARKIDFDHFKSFNGDS